MRERRKIRKKKTDIHKSTLLYRVAKRFTDLSTLLSYSRSQICGLENVPDDGIVIFAPNHCNTLIDALHILRMRRQQTVYGARADLFKKPALAKLLRFLKILPVSRVRDGLSNVTQNYETMAEAYTVLGEGVPFCIFPEGTHRPMHSLLPLKKGIFRMAMEVNSLYPDKTVYVVPCGLEYGDYFRYGRSILIQVGAAINVSAYLDSHKDIGEAALYRDLLDELSRRMSELITYIPDDENYESVWAYTRVMTSGPKAFSLKKRFERRRELISSLYDTDGAIKPEFAGKLAASAAFDRERKAAGISFLSFGFKRWYLRVPVKEILTLCSLPAMLAVCLFSIPSLIVNTILCRKVKDKAFRNSVRDVANLVISILVALITLIVTLCCGMNVFLVLGLTALAYLAPYMIYWIKEWWRVLISDIRLVFKADLRRSFADLRK